MHLSFLAFRGTPVRATQHFSTFRSRCRASLRTCEAPYPFYSPDLLAGTSFFAKDTTHLSQASRRLGFRLSLLPLLLKLSLLVAVLSRFAKVRTCWVNASG